MLVCVESTSKTQWWSHPFTVQGKGMIGIWQHRFSRYYLGHCCNCGTPLQTQLESDGHQDIYCAIRRRHALGGIGGRNWPHFTCVLDWCIVFPLLTKTEGTTKFACVAKHSWTTRGDCWPVNAEGACEEKGKEQMHHQMFLGHNEIVLAIQSVYHMAHMTWLFVREVPHFLPIMKCEVPHFLERYLTF